jgi:hypothetical protein
VLLLPGTVTVAQRTPNPTIPARSRQTRLQRSAHSRKVWRWGREPWERSCIRGEGDTEEEGFLLQCSEFSWDSLAVAGAVGGSGRDSWGVAGP